MRLLTPVSGTWRLERDIVQMLYGSARMRPVRIFAFGRHPTWEWRGRQKGEEALPG